VRRVNSNSKCGHLNKKLIVGFGGFWASFGDLGFFWGLGLLI
jgi:hypothetical protein